MPEADKTQKPKADAVAPVARELYDALIRPVEDLIRTDLVFISPDRSTHFLSFQALNDGTNYFGEKHAIAYAPSASVLKYCIAKRKPATGKILALGNPNLRQAEYKLVNAEKEATELAGAFPDSRALVGNEATEKAVQLLGGDYDVLHFACHGTVDLDEPMQSCLRLSPDKDNDGYLHAGEVFDMHFNAGLVTLSACESGLGKVTQGSEVLGLPRAFMFAGTPSVVASLWKVDDKATAELMKAFYGNLKTMDKAEALRQAQVSMIKQGKSPFYWAAFCLYGDYK
jgi:CHAT domain-containing protein